LRALLDGDLYAFRSAASAEQADVGLAIWRMEEMIDNTLAETSADELSIFLSGDTNFRYSILFEYKANRTAPKPRHLSQLKEYLKEKYSAEVSVGCECDDLLGIAQCKAEPLSTVICSLDKDLRMIPGNHYSWEIRGTSSLGKQWTRPSELVTVDEFSGLKHFYSQLLIGDTSDNIKGCPGIGKVKAAKLLEHCTTEQELFEAVRDAYDSEEAMLANGQCLWIWRKENDIWKIPNFGA
jgi:5'-3' exonuclease